MKKRATKGLLHKNGKKESGIGHNAGGKNHSNFSGQKAQVEFDSSKWQ